MPPPFLAIGMTGGLGGVFRDLHMLRWMGQSNVIGCEAVCNRPEDMEELEKLQPSTHHCPESKRDYMQLEKMGKERVFLHCNDTF